MNNLKADICFLLILIFLGVGGTSCVSVKPIYYDDDKKAAQIQVEKFHQFFNEKKYSEIFDLYTPKGRNQSGKEQFVIDLQNLYTKFGFVKSSRLIKSEVKPQAATRLVHMFYETEFEKGKLVEEFDCLVDEQSAIFDFYGQSNKIPNE